MRRVVAQARRVVAEWEGRIVLIYMPSRLRYMGYDRDARRLEETRRFGHDTVLAETAAR